jgi:RHS repeat-associated protein
MRRDIEAMKQIEQLPVTIEFYHCDHLGTPVALTDQQGQITWAARHDPWGNIEEEFNPNNIEQNIRLPGQYHDRETGLYYNRHRYYDPKIGAYINQDPVGLRGGSNLYRYASQTPLDLIDPLGLDDTLPDLSKYPTDKLKDIIKDYVKEKGIEGAWAVCNKAFGGKDCNALCECIYGIGLAACSKKGLAFGICADRARNLILERCIEGCSSNGYPYDYAKDMDAVP